MYLRLAAFTALAFFSCSRRDKDCCNVQTGLPGTWRLIEIEGGLIAPRLIPVDSPVYLLLNANGAYSVVAQSVLTDSGTFRLTDTTVYGGAPQPAIIFSNGLPPMGSAPQPYSIIADTLSVGSSAADGPELIYFRSN